jgi:trimeric autotransporter adhesin
MLTAVGDMRGAGLTALDAQQAAALAQARASGYDVTQLQQVQAAERATQAFTLAQQDVVAAYDQQIGAQQDLISSLQNGAYKVAQIAKQFASARDALAISQDAPISPQERLAEAKRQWDTALATVRSNSASDTDKDTARSSLISLGQTLTSLEKENSAGTARALYDMVLGVLGDLGTVPQDSAASTADAQLKAAQDSLKELQKGRTEAANANQKSYGALTDLKNIADQSKAEMLAALKPLERLSGTSSTTPHYSAPAQVQAAWDGLSTPQQLGIARGMGWGGQVDDAFNIWLATSSDRAARFGSAVTSIAGGARYGAPDDVQRAWDALTSAQQVAAVRTAGYDSGIDAGLNAWVSLGHQAAFEAAVRGAAHTAGVPGFAVGTLSTPPGAVWVGERGPELLWQGGGAAVASSADSLRIASTYTAAANDRFPANVAPLRPPAAPVASDNREVVAALRDIAGRLERLEAAIRDAEGDAQTQRSRIAQDEVKLMRQQLDELRDRPKKFA